MEALTRGMGPNLCDLGPPAMHLQGWWGGRTRVISLSANPMAVSSELAALSLNPSLEEVTAADGNSLSPSLRALLVEVQSHTGGGG